MATNVFVIDNTVHVRFAQAGVSFCDMVLTPEQAADLSHQLIDKLDMYYSPKKKK
ncbi:MAG: hypothetical protein J6I37_07095 [Prevotella sp.]|jgi:hypothetical protein|nr:hypothetical protein [Prevotella sp.]